MTSATLSRQTQSILRTTSTQPSTLASRASKRVTFAEHVTTMSYSLHRTLSSSESSCSSPRSQHSHPTSPTTPTQPLPQRPRETALLVKGLVKGRTISSSSMRGERERDAVDPDADSGLGTIRDATEGEKRRKPGRVKRKPEKKESDRCARCRKKASKAAELRKARRDADKRDMGMERVERVAREKRRSENGVVKKRGGREVRKRDRAANGVRDKKLRQLRRGGVLARARRYIGKVCWLERGGWSDGMLEGVDPRILTKMYLVCREREGRGKRSIEGRLRRRMVEEEKELRRLGWSGGGKRRRRMLCKFVQDELGLTVVGPAEAGRLALIAVIKRAERVGGRVADSGSRYYS
eukprot:GFKZ01006278.1.p1 GENE.GFKZ01006278.1~~GFKZ01006278.1.p1  ORF type:complete len:381 (-),score=45.39 GFKZ01006278.1:1415-2470(-)